MRPLLLCAAWLGSFFLLAVPAGFAGETGLKPDLRLLVDVSAGMQVADAEDRRAVALEHLLGLLPDGARASLWTFADEPLALVPPGTVDDDWRGQARSAVEGLSWAGTRSNLPEALAAAVPDLDTPEPGYRRAIILLTGGGIDVAESPMINAVAARDLMATLVPRLRANAVPVYSVALSAQADWPLLRALARGTGGDAVRAGTAGQLPGQLQQVLQRAALALQVEAAPDKPTLVTRGSEPLRDDFRLPMLYLAALGLLVLLIAWLVLQRRKRHKLEVWQKRAQHLQAQSRPPDP